MAQSIRTAAWVVALPLWILVLLAICSLIAASVWMLVLRPGSIRDRRLLRALVRRRRKDTVRNPRG